MSAAGLEVGTKTVPDSPRRKRRYGPREWAVIAIGALAVSTLVRTQLTAAPLAGARGLTPTVFDGLREVRAGDLEGRSDTAAVTTYVGCVVSWAAGDLDARVPGSEDGHEFLARYDEVRGPARPAALGRPHLADQTQRLEVGREVADGAAVEAELGRERRAAGRTRRVHPGEHSAEVHLAQLVLADARTSSHPAPVPTRSARCGRLC